MHLCYVRSSNCTGEHLDPENLSQDVGERVTLSSWPACSPPPGVNAWEKLPPPNFPSGEAQGFGPRLHPTGWGCLLGPVLDRGRPRAHTPTQGSWRVSTEAHLASAPGQLPARPSPAHGLHTRFPGVLGEGELQAAPAILGR